MVGDVGLGSEQGTLLETTCVKLDRSARLARVASRMGPCFRSKARPNATHHGAQGTHCVGTVL
jgi:hypothetical protein